MERPGRRATGPAMDVRVRFLRTQQCVKSQCMMHNPVQPTLVGDGFLWLIHPICIECFQPGETFQALFGEFDPGSGRTLAACLTHASRAERPFGVLERRTGE